MEDTSPGSAGGAPDSRPIHVKVAEALGAFDTQQHVCRPIIGHCGWADGVWTGRWPNKHPDMQSLLPRYDLDWSATGPLIERLRIKLRPVTPGDDNPYWEARAFGLHETVEGDSPLHAVCHLILALSEAGKLEVKP